MKVPVKWLEDYVDINVSPKEFADMMTMSGSKVESVEELGSEVSGVLVGKIVSLEKHPDADRLQVSKVDLGGGNVIQIVTGAQNVSVGDYIPAATHGALLPEGKKITKGKLRGVVSEGMMCSVQELGYTRYDFPDAPEDGIYLISREMLCEKYKKSENEIDAEVLGKDACEVLGIRGFVVEFEITPNRPDCLSIIGIAREAAATLGTKFKNPSFSVREVAGKAEEKASVEILDKDLCPRYAARIIKNVKITDSPQWMKERLRAAGIRPINNIVDITNYVMLETGQPMHAFDLDNIKGSKIIVRRSVEGEMIETLDGSKRPLEPGMLVIADKERPVAIAGVMGGGNSEVTASTTNILFESACFNGTSVRVTSKKLGMRTEASSRFEKGLDVNNVVKALDRAAQLVTDLGGGDVITGVIDCYPNPLEPRVLDLKYDEINSLLGTSISREKMINILRSVELNVDEASNKVIIPTFRQDIEEMADISEEVARFYGYNNITPTLLTGKEMTRGRKTPKQKAEDKIRDVLTSSGLYEIYTYSFTSPGVFDMINLPEDSALRNAVKISNPLGTEYSIMRTTTLPDMLSTLSRNFNRRVEEAKLFELSYVYSKQRQRTSLVQGISEDGLPYESLTLTLGMFGKSDFFDLKGVVEELLTGFGISDYEFVQETSNPTFHPGRTAALVIKGEKVGTLGEIHPDVQEKYDISTRVYVASIEAEKLILNINTDIAYKPLPKFPAVSRDIAMLVKDEVTVKKIEDIIKLKSPKILEEIKLFDVYKGKQVPDGMKSVAYSITFRASDRTLTDDEVGKVMSAIVDALSKDLGAQLR